MIQCLECGKFVKAIVYAHLRHCSKINIQEYTKGIYTIKINTKNNVYFSKFIKN